MAELSAVPFSALPTSDDGYTLLNDNGIVHRSSKKLSELVGDKTNSFLTKEEGNTLYQEKGDYLVEDDITGKLDKSQYAVDSATFLTEHQNLDEYATQEWVNNQGFLTKHQSISADEWNDVYETVVANSGTWGTETDWEPDIISASNNAYNSAVEWVKNQNYLTEHQDISNKLDTSSFSEVSSTFLTNEDITGKMDNSYSSNFYPMESNPSGYLTEHQSLDDYATKDWVENKNYLTEHQDISNKMDKSESANFYPMTGNPSRFLTEHQSLDDYATINYVDTEIGKIGSFEVVDLNKENKPVVNEPSTKIIYLTKEIDSEKSDPYTEWIYNDTTSAWECIGETTLDLVNYYKKNETSAADEISAALASNSWKRISEQNGSKNTYSYIGNLSVYIGENNSANSPDSYTLGRNNNSEQGVNVGYYNIIDVNSQEPEPGNFNFGKYNVISGSPGGVNLGQYNSAHSWGVNLGESNIGNNGGYNFGSANSANNGSINIGEKNICFNGGYNFGISNSSNNGSINIGENNTATTASYNIGRYNNTINGYTFGYNNSTNMGFSIGKYNSANDAGYAFGDTLISNASQIIIGKFNAPVDAAVRDGIAWNDTTSAVEPLTQSGVIFAIGNGTYNVTTGITGTYSDGSPKTAYVDASGNNIGSKPLVSEEYITRSNAMVVSADGTVSATRFATSGIADLEAKIKELENIIETYSAKWVLTNN